MTEEARSYWGDSVRCGACYVGRPHTSQEHAQRVGEHVHWPSAEDCARCTPDLYN